MQIGGISHTLPTLSPQAQSPVGKPAAQDPNQLDNSSFKPLHETDGTNNPQLRDHPENESDAASESAKQLANNQQQQEHIKKARLEQEDKKKRRHNDLQAADDKAQRMKAESLAADKAGRARKADIKRANDINMRTLAFNAKLKRLERAGTPPGFHIDQTV